MSKPRSKLKDMAEAGNLWAIQTLAKMQAAAGLPKDPAFAEALRDATDIRQWTDGPNPPPWRVYRLAQALKNA